MNHAGEEGYESQRSALLSVDEVGEFLGISRSGVYRLVRSGEVPSYRVGERLRFRQEEIDTYVDQRKRPVA